MAKEIHLSFNRYLPVDNSAVNFGLYITGYGMQKIPKNSDYPPNNHPPKYAFDFNVGRILPEYQFIFISEAFKNGIFKTRNGIQEIPEESFFLLRPDSWHAYRPHPSAGWREHWIAFNGKIAHKYFSEHTRLKPEQIYSLKNFPAIAKHMGDFTSLLETGKLASAGIVAANFFGLIAKMENSIAEYSEIPKDTESGGSFIDDVKKLIWNWSHTDISAEDIAKSLEITPRTLFRKVAKYKNFSIGEEIDLCKISRAKELIARTDIPLKTIPYLAGYKNIDSMRMAFYRRLGISPARYRKLQSFSEKT